MVSLNNAKQCCRLVSGPKYVTTRSASNLRTKKTLFACRITRTLRPLPSILNKADTSKQSFLKNKHSVSILRSNRHLRHAIASKPHYTIGRGVDGSTIHNHHFVHLVDRNACSSSSHQAPPRGHCIATNPVPNSTFDKRELRSSEEASLQGQVHEARTVGAGTCDGGWQHSWGAVRCYVRVRWKSGGRLVGEVDNVMT